MRASQISINDLLKKNAEVTTKKIENQGANAMMQTLLHDENNFTPSPNKSPSTRYLNKSSDLQPLIENNY
jgi:hypothetical protein